MNRPALLDRYRATRAATEALCAPLEPEDYCVQSCPEASPAKWHLGHTTWFFERLVLQPHSPGYTPWDERLYGVFNSYYESLGGRIGRDVRGTLSRPLVREVADYRRAIDDRVAAFIGAAPEAAFAAAAGVIELGVQHEQQHQELLVTDIKHLFASNPLRPVYANTPAGSQPDGRVEPLTFTEMPAALVDIGAAGPGFAWDNESPRHPVYLTPFALGDRLVTCAEYREFIAAGAYDDPLMWLSEGWDAVRRLGWHAPLYWKEIDGGWHVGTLHGLRPVADAEPVCHVSYFEAEAFARWAGYALPTEFEWEAAAVALAREADGNFLDPGRLHPTPARGTGPARQMFGDVWEWTRSAYLPYPGYRPAPPPLGEYNGKFMVNQMVLRGGSCATPAGHVRATYRNFFHTDRRWQFTGIRLVRRSEPGHPEGR